ncbi:MAG: GHKL domain-containing protein [Bacteroidetes bacterium]|nr:GHKL domain-containing protein [Bacteroidota bacterium]
MEKTPTDINELSKEYLQLAYHAYKAINQGFRVDVETILDSELGVKVINEQDIGRVILNVITNALYAVGERQKQSNDDYKPKVKLLTQNGPEMFTISVQDNGSGIPDEIKDKIFEPFFTTKKGTDGTGLGLSISYDIVKAHDGRLEIQSDSNGTLVSILLPA